MQSDEFKDRRLKYVQLPQVFHMRASDINITSKQHLRACEKLAIWVSKQKPKNVEDFERVEWLRDFVTKTADLNDKTITLLDYLKTTIQEIADDARALMDGGVVLDRLRDQEDTITMLQRVRDEAIQSVYELRKTHIRESKANLK
jgi:hypothetical protein